MQITDKTRKSIFFVLMLTSIIGSMIQTALSTALTPIMEDMSISADTAQWLTSSHTLIMGIMVLATAFLIRRFTCRTLFMVSMALLNAGLLLSALSSSFYMLLTGRILQAISSGILTSLTQVVILSTYPPEKRGSAMGIFGLAVCAAPVLAPAIAGLISDYFGWRMFFGSVFIISLSVYIFGFFTMENVTQVQKMKFDIISMVLCSIGFIGIVTGVGNWGKNSFLSLPVLAPVAIGIISLLFFVYRQFSIKEPFLKLKVFSNREFRTGVIASMLLYCGMIAASVLLPLYIQSMRSYSATVSGLIMMPGSLMTAVVSPFAGKVYDKIGIRKLYIFGASFLLAGNIGLCFLSDTTLIPLILVFFALRQIAIGLLLMPTVTWSMSTLDRIYVSDGTALITSLRTISGAIGSAAFVAVMMTVAKSPDAADMIQGVNAAFVGISLLSLAIFLLALFSIKNTETTPNPSLSDELN